MSIVEDRIKEVMRPIVKSAGKRKVVLTVSNKDISELNKSIEQKIQENRRERNRTEEMAAGKFILG
jgi:hypothetical protein